MRCLSKVTACIAIVLCFAVTISMGQSLKEEWLEPGVSYALQGEFEKAKQEFKEAMANQDFIEEAEEYYNVCEDALEKRIEKQAAVYFFEAVMHGRRGEKADVIASSEKAIQLSQDFVSAYILKAIALTKDGNYDGAIATLSEAVSRNPNYSKTYVYLGLTHAGKGDYPKAIAAFTTAIELSQENASAYEQRGATYISMNEYDKAIADFERAIQLKPGSALAYHERGFVYLKKGQVDASILDFTKALEIQPSYARAYLNRAAAYIEKEDYDKALLDCSRAIAINPKYAAAYSERGYAWYKKGVNEFYKKDILRAGWIDEKFVRQNLPIFFSIASLRKNPLEGEWGSDMRFPYASQENPIHFQRAEFRKPNRAIGGPALYYELPTIYPTKLDGIHVSASDLLSGAIGMLFLDEKGAIGAFFPLAIEAPEEYWRNSYEPIDLSSVQDIVATWNALRNLNPMIVEARNKGQEPILFVSDNPPSDSLFAKWPPKLPLKTRAVLIFVPENTRILDGWKQ
jgi:tetratricopeptide (TPR) repeat protein